MKNGLLDRIKAGSRWRVRITPKRGTEPEIRLSEAQEIVSSRRISIRGWDFPHISNRSDECGGFERHNHYLENWTDWSTRQEFWRFYKSGQFVFMERLEEQDRPIPNVAFYVDMVGAIYSITEFFLFANRVAGHKYFQARCDLEIMYAAPEPTHLLAGRGRIPFFETRRFDGTEIKIKKSISHTNEEFGGRKMAAEALLEFFDHFGWNPDISQIDTEQEKYFSRQFSY